MTDIKKKAFETVEHNARAISLVGDSIFHFAELAMQEFETCGLLRDVLTQMGFKVETGISGFPTAVLATYGSGKPVLAVHTEFDALPSGSQVPGVTNRQEVAPGAPGHAEGHHSGPAVALGALWAAKQAMDEYALTGTLKFFGVPAEELTLARPFFVRDGYLDDVDAAMWCHVGSELETSYGVRNYGIVSVEFEFFGRTAHSAVSPWTGISAVDAAKLMDIGWDVLREHLPPTQRSHSVIASGGSQPNVVPDYAKIWYYFRESTGEGARELYEKARKVAEGAALMTGCSWKDNVLAACWPGHDSEVLARVIQANMDLVGQPNWDAEEHELARNIQQASGVPIVGLAENAPPLKRAEQGTHSNDGGDITWKVPHGKIHYPSNIPGVPFHHWCAAIAGTTSIAHKGQIAGAKALAGTLLDLLTKSGLVEEVRACFDRETQAVEYKPLLPPGAKPPVGINADVMAKYKKDLEQWYVKEKIEFK